MTERLEEIKTRFNAMKELESFKKLAPTDLFFDDLNWLLQQAERVEELEKVEYALQETYRQEREYNKKLEQQNECYKQALEFYADERTYEVTETLPPTDEYQQPIEPVFKDVPIIYYDKGKEARQALEREGRA